MAQDARVKRAACYDFEAREFNRCFPPCFSTTLINTTGGSTSVRDPRAPDVYTCGRPKKDQAEFPAQFIFYGLPINNGGHAVKYRHVSIIHTWLNPMGCPTGIASGVIKHGWENLELYKWVLI